MLTRLRRLKGRGAGRSLRARGFVASERTAAVGKRWIWSTGASVRRALSWATRRAAEEDMAARAR